ncbi:MAG: HemK2/MTQ2 family protein methyltransferase [Candidatus Micrarchaeota archaeon]
MTVSFRGLRFEVFPGVYEPAEDSFMLAEFSKDIIGDSLDVGTGCGIQAIVAKKARVVGVDSNEVAVENAEHNARMNGSNAMFVGSDLFESVDGKFDCIVFNPPYLPTSPNEVVEGSEDVAWNGGKDGREVIDRFLDGFADHLKEDGRLLMLCSSLSERGESKRTVERLGFRWNELTREHVGMFEELFVVEMRRA